jgi:hypothetical protein
MNFGILKDIFANKLVESHLSKDSDGKLLYKTFINTLKENDVLKSQFIVYKNLERTDFTNEVEASNYLKENISVLKKYSSKEINESNLKLAQPVLFEQNTPNSSNNKLYKAIHTLITEKKTASNLNKLHESFEIVKSSLTSNEDNTYVNEKFVKEGVNPDKFLDIAVKRYNEKYSELSEEEKSIIKTLRENDEESIKDLVSKLTDENIRLINQNLEIHTENIDIKEKLLEVKDVVYRMKEDNDSFSEKVLKLLELKDSLSYD